MELKNKIALVTEAGQGIGKAIALRLAQEGANTIVVDIDLEIATETGRNIRDLGREALAEEADVSLRDHVRAVVEVGLDRFVTIDILVNNAGIGGSSCLVRDLPEEAWDRVMNMMIGLVTPPIGILLFLTSSMAQARLEKVVREMVPFLIALLLVLTICTYVPGVVMWLPDLLMK